MLAVIVRIECMAAGPRRLNECFGQRVHSLHGSDIERSCPPTKRSRLIAAFQLAKDPQDVLRSPAAAGSRAESSGPSIEISRGAANEHGRVDTAAAAQH